MSHYLNPASYGDHIRGLLRKALQQAEEKQSYEVGPISWRPNYGVFEKLPFHAGDDPYYFECSAGLTAHDAAGRGDDPMQWFEPDFDRGTVLFTPDFTIFHKGTAPFLVYADYPSVQELDAIKEFYRGHYVRVWVVRDKHDELTFTSLLEA